MDEPPIQVLLIEGNPTDALLLRQALARVSCPSFAEEEVRRLNEELEQRVMQRTAQLEASNRNLAPEIAARQRSEEVIRTLNTALEQRVAELNTANQELEAFSYSISHDLRAPLCAIHSYACILLEDYAPQLEAEAQQYLPRVSENALRMGQLVDDLLTFARLGRQQLHRQAPAVERVDRGGGTDRALLAGAQPRGAGLKVAVGSRRTQRDPRALSG